jgi:hypothetical protein
MVREIGIGHHVVQEIAASLIAESMCTLGSSLAKGGAQTSVHSISSQLLEQYAVKGNDSLQHVEG